MVWYSCIDLLQYILSGVIEIDVSMKENNLTRGQFG